MQILKTLPMFLLALTSHQVHAKVKTHGNLQRIISHFHWFAFMCLQHSQLSVREHIYSLKSRLPCSVFQPYNNMFLW